ncbi:MAG TPA: hypothetical protein VMQ51_14980 [Candidatus Binatia bacterium]|nr:hypothetical protein [Candidatus Binatia bacterium]
MRVLVAVLLVLLLVPLAWAGHELTFYPAFYPQGVIVQWVEPRAAGPLLLKNALHAYAGADPLAGAPSEKVRHVESLRGWVVLTFARPSGAAEARCAAGAAIVRALGGRAPFVVHPWPVTPYHDDYVQQYDLVQRARERVAGTTPRVRATGALGAALAAAGVTVSAEADAAVEEITLASLLAGVETRLAGWQGPAWLKEGWFQAWLLQAPALPPAARGAGEETFRRRAEGAPLPVAERINLERRLVGQATAGCERVVLGYTVRREALNDDYYEGVENIAVDSQAGVASPIFLRTVKLKDFPWNGWLHVGTEGGARAAWNPIAGFTDPAGRAVWAAVGDPALLFDPDNARLIPNRARPQSIEEEGEVPADALVPAAGELKPAGAGVAARQKIVYRVVLSNLHDGQKMSVADILYPYAFATRWGVSGARAWDPEVERATATLRRALAAVRVVRVDMDVRAVDDQQYLYQVAVVEVYLKTALDPRYAAAAAPPWSPVPWPVMALMEQAVARGRGAFSEREARRRHVPWLDLVRDRKTMAALTPMVADFERRAWVPDALRGLVTPEQARARWRALREFQRRTGHVLVTAGPYQVGRVTAEAATLPVFRDFTYPLGVGSFDQYAIPVRAYIRAVDRRGDRLAVQADVENVEKAGRSYKIVRGPFTPAPPGESTREPLTVHWTVVGPGDEVAAAGASRDVQGGRLVVDLAGRVRPGAYRVVLALALNGNLVNPEVTVVSYRAGD